jgi:hypothetical protein
VWGECVVTLPHFKTLRFHCNSNKTNEVKSDTPEKWGIHAPPIYGWIHAPPLLDTPTPTLRFRGGGPTRMACAPIAPSK